MARTILVVEDSKSVRTALRWVLRKSGDTVVTATGFNEGKGHDVPDVAIVDYHLPDGSAVDLAKHFHDAGAATIVMGGEYHDFTSAPFESVGIRHVLHKPFRSDDVLNVIDAALAGESNIVADAVREDSSAAADTTQDDSAPETTDSDASQSPPPPPSISTTPPSSEPRTARGTMALKGMPRPTESAVEDSDRAPEEAPAALEPPTGTGSVPDEAAQAELTDTRTTPSPTAVTNTLDTANEAALKAEESSASSEQLAEDVTEAAPDAEEAPESIGESTSDAEVAPETTDETTSAAEVAQVPSAEIEAERAQPDIDMEELRELVRGMVQNEIAIAVKDLVEDGLDTRLPGLVKDAIREMLREELNEKVVGYAKRKIDAFASNDLPRIAARVVERKS